MPFLRRLMLGLLSLVCVMTWMSGTANAKQWFDWGQSDTIRLSELPNPGPEIYTKIHQGADFEHEKDGSVFGNRERVLPANKRGFYREYTVPTPGLSHRGKRRIVCGGPAKAPEICYYTADHYASFRKIVP